jgi:hypothetical protein
MSTPFQSRDKRFVFLLVSGERPCTGDVVVDRGGGVGKIEGTDGEAVWNVGVQ